MTDGSIDTRDQLAILSTIKSIFEDNGLADVSEDVQLNLLDVIAKHVGDLLNEAKLNALYANRTQPNKDDIDLAIESKVQSLVIATPHRQVLHNYADRVNSLPLPSIKPVPGLKLAPEKYSTTAPNFTISCENGEDVSLNPPSRLVVPSMGAMPVYRVPNTPGSQRKPLITVPSSNAGATSDMSAPSIHVIAPGSASASMMRIQQSGLSQSNHSILSNTISNSVSSASNLLRSFTENQMG